MPRMDAKRIIETIHIPGYGEDCTDAEFTNLTGEEKLEREFGSQVGLNSDWAFVTFHVHGPYYIIDNEEYSDDSWTMVSYDESDGTVTPIESGSADDMILLSKRLK